MNRTPLLSLSLLAAGALVGGTLAMPVTAKAKHRRVHASDCAPANSSSTYSTLIYGGIGPWTSSGPGNGQVQGSGTGFVCPIDDDSTFTKHEIETLNVHGYEGSTQQQAYAVACRTSWWGGTGYCGAWGASSISGTGQFTLQPNLGQWSSFSYADFGYVFVGLPNGSSSFRGYFIAD